MTARRVLSLTVVCALGFLLAACGDGSTNGTTPAPAGLDAAAKKHDGTGHWCGTPDPWGDHWLNPGDWHGPDADGFWVRRAADEEAPEDERPLFGSGGWDQFGVDRDGRFHVSKNRETREAFLARLDRELGK